MSEQLDEFAKQVLELAKNIQPRPLEEYPYTYYDLDGNCLEVMFKPTNYYGRCVTGTPIVIYYEQDTDEIVGFYIGAAHRFPEFVLKAFDVYPYPPGGYRNQVENT